MSELWSGLVGAVIGGVLAGGASLVAGFLTARSGTQAALRERRLSAYGGLIASCGLIGFTAAQARLLMELRCGVGEGLAVLTRRSRKPRRVLPR